MKYIFITGGVVSGLGKGITAASLGRLLKQRGYKISCKKLDPYLNIDPGTMNPIQHGEVFITNDGTETDLDLGHYERFINEDLNKYSNLTSGKVYWNLLQKERYGQFLGQTIQVIPHVTNEIKEFINTFDDNGQPDILIVEIGGTVGDIESQPFIEAIRQISMENDINDCCFIHVTYIPYLSGSDEYKSKPTQHSVKDLQIAGIRPNIIVCRADGKLPESIKDKISLFCNVKRECIIENNTVSDLYQAPLMLENQNLSSIVLKQLNLKETEIDLEQWQQLNDKILNCNVDVNIALVGKYTKLHDAYLSVVEALKHAGYHNLAKVNIKWVEYEDLTEDNLNSTFENINGIIVPGGFGDRGIEKGLLAIKYARENNVPYLGICLGMQLAVIEFARNVLGYKDANSSEFNQDSKHKVIDLMLQQYNINQKGATMRLGSYPCLVKEDSLLMHCYKEKIVHERHRHRYEFNNDYRKEFEENGLSICGTSLDDTLVEAIELVNHPFFIGLQSHPEFKSRPNKPHPVFFKFIESSIKNK